MAGKRNHPEDALTESVATYLRLQEKRFNYLSWHVPNGGNRNAREGARFKKMGVRAGIPDIHIAHLGLLHCIELKAGKGSISASQDEIIKSLDECCVETIVCRSLDDVKRAMTKWGIF